MKVICTLPNASDLISGVRFVSHAQGMISEEISDEKAAAFLGIPGYKAAGEPTPPPTSAPTSTSAPAGDPAGGSKTGEGEGGEHDDATDLEALRIRGAELGIPNAALKGAKRLKEEIAEAEAAAKGKA